MARSRARKTEVQPADNATSTVEDTSFDPVEYESAADYQRANGIVHGVAESTRTDHADESPREHDFQSGHHVEHAERQKPPAMEPRKKWTPPRDPFGFESQRAGENRVQLLKSENRNAWLIRFAHNPNLDKGPDGESYSKENPHPVLAMLKAEGYRWGFDQDDIGGWGKPFSRDAYVQDHIDAKRVLQQAADMIGHKMDHGRIPD